MTAVLRMTQRWCDRHDVMRAHVLQLISQLPQHFEVLLTQAMVLLIFSFQLHPHSTVEFVQTQQGLAVCDSQHANHWSYT